MVYSHVRMLTIVGLLFCFYGYTFGWAATSKFPANTKYPGKCYIGKGSLGNGEPVQDTILSTGQTQKASPGNCYDYTCGVNNGKEFFVRLTGCGVVSGPPECQKVTRRHRIFPRCCPTIVC